MKLKDHIYKNMYNIEYFYRLFQKRRYHKIYKPLKELLWSAFEYEFVNSDRIYRKSLCEEMDTILELLNHFKKGAYKEMAIKFEEIKRKYNEYKKIQIV